jgi:hypothetical protein
VKALTWRRLAIAGAASSALLTARILLSPQVPLWRWLHPEQWRSWPPLAEPWDVQIERRLDAVELHLQHLPPERVS